MNPIQAPQVINSRNLGRRVLCAHYSHCLDLTIEAGWEGFTCQECRRYQQEAPSDADHWNEQDKRCRALFGKIFSQKSSPREASARRYPKPMRLIPEHTARLREESHRLFKIWLDREAQRMPKSIASHLMRLYEQATLD